MVECVHISVCVCMCVCARVCMCLCTGAIIVRAGQCPELTPANHTAVQTSNRWPFPGQTVDNVTTDNIVLLLVLE